MLHKASDLKGFDIAASDDLVGHVSDAFFDDSTWAIRWLVVETGHWLSHRNILLPASALERVDPTRREFAVKVTSAQVEASPYIDAHQPISRQMETGIYDHYGWGPLLDQGLLCRRIRRI